MHSAVALAFVTTVAATAVAGCADTAPPRSAESARAAPAQPQRSTRVAPAAVFTGEYVNGLPVYRLPPIDVVASRKAELARPVAEMAEAVGRAAADAASGPAVAGRVYRPGGDEAPPPRPL